MCLAARYELRECPLTCRRHLAKRLTEQFDSLRARGMNFDDALNRCAMLAIKAANAHVQKFMYENNEIAIEQFFKKQDTPATGYMFAC